MGVRLQEQVPFKIAAPWIYASHPTLLTGTRIAPPSQPYAEMEAVLLWAPHEKARFSGKDRNAGKGWRQLEKRKTKYEMGRLMEATR